MADISQRVIWTVLPKGIDGDYITFTALVSPRLTIDSRPQAPLEKWPDFLNWPEHILNAKFHISFAGNTFEAERVSMPDPAVWTALFGTNTSVFNHAFQDRRNTAILSYPMAEVHDFVTSTYMDLGFSIQDDLPDKRDIFGMIDNLAPKEYQDEIKFQLHSLSKLKDGTEGRQYFSGTTGAFTLQELYHMPLAAPDFKRNHYIKEDENDIRENAQWRQHRFYDLPDENDLAYLIDFHQIVSALNQYPQLLRLTGLATDLRLPKGRFPTSPTTGALSLKVDWHPTPMATSDVHTHNDVYPLTMTEWHKPKLSVEKRYTSTPLSNGMLFLEDQKRFRLMQMDVDGAGIKLRNTARSFLNSKKPSHDESPDPAGVANIRTVGFQLVEVDRHLSLSESFNNSGKMQDALEHSNHIELYAEDLIRGFHVDILDETRGNGWQSLCRRDGHYEFLNTSTSIKTEDEEGMIRLAAQEAMDETDPNFQDIAKISEQIFAWTGWSLTTPRTGLAIDTDDEVNSTRNTAPPDLPLETSFRVRAGSLPSLRFGHKYRVRVRVADLAGNAVDPKPGDHIVPPEASHHQTFRRYEPVPVPLNALVNAPGGLEKPSDGEAMSRPAIRSFNEKKSDNTVATTEEMRRHIVPPRSSQVMTELHGAIDSSPGQPDPDWHQVLATKDGDLTEVKVLHEDPLTASSDLVPYSAAEESFDLPYLPDVLAHTAVVRLVFDPSSGSAERLEIPYYDSTTQWPDAQPFKIRIFEDSSASIKFDKTTRTLNVPLAKAEVMHVRVSHGLQEDNLNQLALWNIIKSHPKMDQVIEEQLRKHVLSGAHWMLTPWLEMELVHAVQKPLIRPAFLALSGKRILGETAADITFRSPIHAKSTDKTELMGRWREPCDIPAEGPPRVINRSSSAFETRLARTSAPNEKMSGMGKHAFEDTRFRQVRYRLEATTRYKEFMPPAIRQNPSAMTITSDHQDEFIENSAIPSAPELIEVVPTFGWQRKKTQKQVSSFRSGGGIRVWLKRPWFTTGFGEMLGVVVASSGTPNSDLTDKLAKHVTQWGADPIWRSGIIPSPSPTAASFPLRIMGGPIPTNRSPEFVPEEERNLPSPFEKTTELTLPESNGAKVNVVPHGVNFDPERDQYYADIIVKPGGSYYPFIRLALTRFHPVSSPGAHLSPSLIANWMQLTPDRLLIMTKGDQPSQRKLQLFGHIYSRSAYQEERRQRPYGPIIKAEIQARDNSIEGELSWKKVKRSIPVPFEPYMLTFDPGSAPLLKKEANDLLEHVTHTLHIDLDMFVQLRPPLMWEKTITLPRRRSGEDLRIMVCEYEKHVVDKDRSDLADTAVDPELRLVYAETLTV